MGDQRFLRRFLHALRPGAYLAIVDEGELGAGDAVEVVHRPEHAVSLALVVEALLIDRSRLRELEPARSDMLPKLAGWFEELRPAA
jgi:MOSC domain-containing protein YiiM